MPMPIVSYQDDEVVKMLKTLAEHFGIQGVDCPNCMAAQLPAPFCEQAPGFHSGLTANRYHWFTPRARLVVARAGLRAVPLFDDFLMPWFRAKLGGMTPGHHEHLPTEALQEPCILAPLPDNAKEYVLLDGLYRARQLRRNNQPVFAYVLTARQSLDCMLRPDDMRATAQALENVMRSQHRQDMMSVTRVEPGPRADLYAALEENYRNS